MPSNPVGKRGPQPRCLPPKISLAGPIAKEVEGILRLRSDGPKSPGATCRGGTTERLLAYSGIDHGSDGTDPGTRAKTWQCDAEHHGSMEVTCDCDSETEDGNQTSPRLLPAHEALPAVFSSELVQALSRHTYRPLIGSDGRTRQNPILVRSAHIGGSVQQCDRTNLLTSPSNRLVRTRLAPTVHGRRAPCLSIFRDRGRAMQVKYPVEGGLSDNRIK